MAYKPFIADAKTAFGELQVASLSPIFQNTFEYTVDNTELLTNVVVSGGTVTQANGMGVVGSSTTTTSTACLQSAQHARYHAGTGGLSRFTALWSAPVATTEMFVGLADETGSSATFKNGYMVGYDGTTFGFHRFQNDSKITVALSAWDDPLDGTGPSGITLDTTKINVFQIQFQYLGAGAIRIYVEDSVSGDFVLAHSIQYANTQTEPSVHNPNFHHTMWVNNAGTTSDVEIKSASFVYFVEGEASLIQIHQPQFASGIQEQTTVTSEVALFTIRNKTTYVGKTNFIDILVEGFGSSIEASSANNLGSVRIVKDAILGGAPSYSDINTTNSVIELDTSATTVTSGTDLLDTSLAGKNDKVFLDLTRLQIILHPGNTLTIAGTSSNSATMDANILWKELF